MLPRIRDECPSGAGLTAAAGAGEENLAHRVEAAHARGREPSGGKVRLDRKTRDEGDAVTREHGAARGLLEPELEPDVQVTKALARLAEFVLDHLPDARPFLHHDQRLGAQLIEGDGLPGKAMLGRAGEHDLVAEERLEHHSAVTSARAHDAKLELALGDAVDDRLRVGDREPNADLGVLLLELAEQERDDGAARPRRGAELERPRERALLVLGQILEEALLERQQSLGRRVQTQPCLGRLDAAARTVQELSPEALLQRPDLEADGRLGDAEPLRRLGEALALHHRAERRQLPRIHKRSLCKMIRLRRSTHYHRSVSRTSQSGDSFILRFAELTEASPARRRDAVLRTLDVVFAGFFLLATLPLTIPIAAVLLVASGRPLFYRGERVGRGGQVFRMLKFRTLRPNAEERLGPYLGEELVRRTRLETTPIGRWLRATQLDEIPQLWNVLRGDMSLVGPRPIRPRFFAELAEELPAYWQRLVVRPGLTGFAQVRRGYETSMAEKLAHDLEWIADRSVRLYLRTLAVTVLRVLRQFGRGIVGH